MWIQSILWWFRWWGVSDSVAKWPPPWVIQWWQFSEKCVYFFLRLLHLLFCFSLGQKENKIMMKKMNKKCWQIKRTKCEQLTFCVFCCTVVTMALSTLASEERTEFVSVLCCSFICERVPCSLALSSGLKLSPRSDRNSSTERIVSVNKSLLVWRSISTPYS